MLRNTFRILFFFSLLLSIRMHAQNTWSLKQCINKATESNNELQELKLNITKAKINYTQSTHNKYPNIQAGIRSGNNSGLFIDPTTNILDFGNNYVNQFQLASSLNLFSGFYNKYLKNMRFDEINASEYLFQKKLNEISLEITYYFYQILIASETARFIQKSLETLENRKKVIEGNVNAEMIHKRNLSNIEYLIAEQETNLLINENMVLKNTAHLLFLMGLTNTETIIISPINSDIESHYILFDYETVKQKALDKFPDLKLGHSQIEIAENMSKIAYSERYPKIFLQGNLGTKTSSSNNTTTFGKQLFDNNYQYIGLNMVIPIYQNNEIKQQIALAKTDTEITKLKVKTLVMELENNIYNALMDYNSAYKLYKSFQKQQASVSEEYAYAIRLFDIGNMGLFEFTDISERYIESEKSLILAKADLMLKRSIIGFYTGETLE